MNISITPPWVEYGRKIATLFEQDPTITVSEVTNSDDGYSMTIEVSNHEKFVALDRAMATKVQFGNVTLTINLVDADSGSDMDWLKLYTTIFTGNGRLKDVRVVEGMGFSRGYVRFVPEVLQFQNDDLSDASGNWSGLAQDIAREIFANNTHGVSFCTADIRENNGEVLACGSEFTLNAE